MYLLFRFSMGPWSASKAMARSSLLSISWTNFSVSLIALKTSFSLSWSCLPVFSISFFVFSSSLPNSSGVSGSLSSLRGRS